MAVRHYRGNLFYDSDGIEDVRDDITAVQWEQQVLRELVRLFETPPVRTSGAVLHAINATKRKITIVPAEDGDDAAERPNHTEDGVDKGLPVLQCGTHAGQPDRKGRIGTGRGTDSIIRFTPQDFDSSNSVPGDGRDETLLHELVHGLRDARGQARCISLPEPALLRRKKRFRQDYDDVEEFLAILITNIYRSEKKRPGLRRDHDDPRKKLRNGTLATLPYPFTYDRDFYIQWQATMDTLCKRMLRLFIHIANIPTDWNPIKHCVMSVLRLDLPERLRDFEATLNANGW
jgi:hypothetical protein